jgi:hypothetical protein
MTALPSAAVASATPATRTLMAFLRVLLLAEAGATLGLAIFLSMVASGLGDGLAGSAGAAGETAVRFAAGAAFLFAIFATVASRGARRRRAWAWTLGAMLQVILAIGTGIAVVTATWHPAYLVGFGLAAAVMTVLSTASVRRALGQD